MPPPEESPLPNVHLTDQMKKNCAFLQVFCEINTDAIADNADEMGILGKFLTMMGEKDTKTEVIKGVLPYFSEGGGLHEGDEHKTVKQPAWVHYQHVISTLQEGITEGLPRYTLSHIETAMEGGGLMVMGRVPKKHGNWFHVNYQGLGLTHTYPLLQSIHTPVSVMVKACAKEQVAIEAVSADDALHFQPSDYNRVFKAACVGSDEYDAKCAKLGDEGSCKTDDNCKWAGAWDGSESSVIQQAEAAAEAYLH